VIQEHEKSGKWKRSHNEEPVVGATRNRYKIYMGRTLGK
jgi:hypothetical protein